MNFYGFHIGDYASATRHLTWLEDAAYRRMLDVYYVKEGPLPLDRRQIYRLVVASSDTEREAVDVILDEFFEETVDGYRHQRCEEEIAVANDKKEKASLSAQKRWSNARTTDDAHAKQTDSALHTESERNANASNDLCERITDAPETLCEGNAPNPNPNPNKTTTRAPDGFAEFWEAYPKKVGKGAAEASWKKHRPPLGLVLEAIKRVSATDQWRKEGGQFVPNPTTWLNQRRWEDGANDAPAEDPKSVIPGTNLTRARADFLQRMGL